jgi:hypothetical protein
MEINPVELDEDHLFAVVVRTEDGGIRWYSVAKPSADANNVGWDYFGGTTSSKAYLASTPNGPIVVHHDYGRKRAVVYLAADDRSVVLPGNVDWLGSCDVLSGGGATLVVLSVRDDSRGYLGYDRLRIHDLGRTSTEIEVDRPIAAVRAVDERTFVAALDDGVLCIELLHD